MEKEKFKRFNYTGIRKFCYKRWMRRHSEQNNYLNGYIKGETEFENMTDLSKGLIKKLQKELIHQYDSNI